MAAHISAAGEPLPLEMTSSSGSLFEAGLEEIKTAGSVHLQLSLHTVA